MRKAVIVTKNLTQDIQKVLILFWLSISTYTSVEVSADFSVLRYLYTSTVFRLTGGCTKKDFSRVNSDMKIKQYMMLLKLLTRDNLVTFILC